MSQLFEVPKKMEHVYIHKKNKDYVISIVEIEPKSGSIIFKCLASEDGITGALVTTGILAETSLPKPEGDIFFAASVLSKYLAKNGYKSVTTITQTKHGVKLS